MLDQDTARALLTIADETGARLALVGDRHQLPAVGRGGVLDLAARWASPEARLTLDTVHRFTDPEYAELSLLDADRRAQRRGLRPARRGARSSFTPARSSGSTPWPSVDERTSRWERGGPWSRTPANRSPH